MGVSDSERLLTRESVKEQLGAKMAELHSAVLRGLGVRAGDAVNRFVPLLTDLENKFGQQLISAGILPMDWVVQHSSGVVHYKGITTAILAEHRAVWVARGLPSLTGELAADANTICGAPVLPIGESDVDDSLLAEVRASLATENSADKVMYLFSVAMAKTRAALGDAAKPLTDMELAMVMANRQRASPDSGRDWPFSDADTRPITEQEFAMVMAIRQRASAGRERPSESASKF